MAKRKAKSRPAAKKAAKKSARDLPCLCGCGKPTISKKAKFIPGHDAKLKSILMKVETGELDESAIPDIAREFLANCTCCGQPIMEHDSGMGPVCRAGHCKCENRKKAAAVAGKDKKESKEKKEKSKPKIKRVRKTLLRDGTVETSEAIEDEDDDAD